MIQFFVPGRITNPLNGSHSHWSVRAKWARTWRSMTSLWAKDTIRQAFKYWPDPTKPKRITFTGTVVRRFDDDNFRAAMKPIRDGLKDAGLIHDDAWNCGHTFEYVQKVGKHLGVMVTVE